jgi:predicted permease
VIRQNLRSTVRFIRRQPLFAGAIVAMLALGIGSTTAIFSVVYGVLLKPLPFPDADRIVQVWGSRPDRGWDQVSLTEANFWDMLDMNQSLQDFGAWHGASAILTDGAEPEQVTGALVTSGFFRSLGVQPVVGRLFEPNEDTPAGGGTVRPLLLSHALWVRRYGSDRTIVGRTIAFGSGPRTVVGVLPAGTPWLDGAEVFIPMVRRADAERGSFEYSGVGRLKPGVTMAAALADLTVVAKNLERRYPQPNTGLGVAIDGSRSWIASDDLRRMLWILLGSVGLLLVIACVNVTNLMLARASANARDSAVRAALGASRSDLVRQWVTEALILSAIGTAAGLALATALLRAMQAASPGDIPRLDEVTVNGWAFAMAGAVATIAGIVIGLVPALRAPQADVVPALRNGQRGAVGDRRESRLRNVFVGAEVALAVMLLIGAGLLVRSLAQVLTVDRGFHADHRLVATLTIPGSYPEARSTQTAADLMARVRALPGVISVAAVSGRPLSRGSTGLGLAAADRPDTPGAAVPWATWRVVTKDYFEAMGVPVVAGRAFNADDLMGKPWRTVISQRAADLLWPGQNPIGRTAILWKGQGDTRAEVIGVVGNMRERGLEADPTLAVYFPGDREPRSSLQLIVHAKTQPEDLVPSIRAAIASVDRQVPLSNPRSLDAMVTASVATRRFTMLLLAAFAGLALLLAIAGVYGVLAYSVARRVGEIGLMLALGAEHGRLLRFVVVQGLRPVLLGMVAGLTAAFWLSGLMTSLLFGIQPGDPLTYVGAALVLLLTAAAACYVPARSVLRVDPAVALRAD